MAFDFDKLKENLVSAGKEVEEFAKDTSKVAKLKYEIHTKEDFLEKQYALLGRAFYHAHKHEEVDEKVYFPSIAEAEEELARLNAELLDTQGSVVCPGCGEKQSDKNDFCASCGNALKQLTKRKSRDKLNSVELKNKTLRKREYIYWNFTEKLPLRNKFFSMCCEEAEEGKWKMALEWQL